MIYEYLYEKADTYQEMVRLAGVLGQQGWRMMAPPASHQTQVGAKVTAFFERARFPFPVEAALREA